MKQAAALKSAAALIWLDWSLKEYVEGSALKHPPKEEIPFGNPIVLQFFLRVPRGLRPLAGEWGRNPRRIP